MTFLLRRVGFYLLTAWIAVTINFFLPRLMPGNPLGLILTRYRSEATPAQVHSLETTFGLDTNQGLFAQYLHYLNQLLHGNLGVSITYFPENISTVTGHALPWTIVLVGTAIVIAFISSYDPSPFPWYNKSLNYALSAPIGSFASGDQQRWNDPPSTALLAQHANAQTNAQLQKALNRLEGIEVTEAPIVPFAEAVAWSEYSTAKVTGWPSASNPYDIASPAGSTAEYEVLHLEPVNGS
jgi:hypothetical protein